MGTIAMQDIDVVILALQIRKDVLYDEWPITRFVADDIRVKIGFDTPSTAAVSGSKKNFPIRFAPLD
jgi:hypothetical protein